jgi:hypothetical protein
MFADGFEKTAWKKHAFVDGFKKTAANRLAKELKKNPDLLGALGRRRLAGRLPTGGFGQNAGLAQNRLAVTRTRKGRAT